MRQKFVNATSASCRKGHELSAQRPEAHPTRPQTLQNPVSWIPNGAWMTVPKPKVVVAQPLSDLDKMKNEILKAMREMEPKAKPVPKSKLIGLGFGNASSDTRSYEDVLALLLAKK